MTCRAGKAPTCKLVTVLVRLVPDRGGFVPAILLANTVGRHDNRLFPCSRDLQLSQLATGVRTDLSLCCSFRWGLYDSHCPIIAGIVHSRGHGFAAPPPRDPLVDA